MRYRNVNNGLLEIVFYVFRPGIKMFPTGSWSLGLVLTVADPGGEVAVAKFSLISWGFSHSPDFCSYFLQDNDKQNQIRNLHENLTTLSKTLGENCIDFCRGISGGSGSPSRHNFFDFHAFSGKKLTE